MAGELWEALFEIMATRRGPHWFLSTQEKDRLGVATIRLASAYIKLEKLTKAGPKLGFGLAVGLPVGRRMVVDAQLMRMAMMQQMAHGQQPPPAGQAPPQPTAPPDPSQYYAPYAPPAPAAPQPGA